LSCCIATTSSKFSRRKVRETMTGTTGWFAFPRTFSGASPERVGELPCLYLSVADSKFTSAIVVRNVLSIYLVTFIPAMSRFLACHLFFAVTPLASTLPSPSLSIYLLSVKLRLGCEIVIPRNLTSLVC